MKVDAIVLGAGVAGLSTAHLLLNDHRTVHCLEPFAHVGGNHRSCDIGPYTFDIGNIVFYPDYSLFRFFPSLLDLCVPFHQQLSRVAKGGTVRAYPFELKEAFGSNPFQALANAASMIAGRIMMPRPKNVDEYCIHMLGRRFYDTLGLKTFVERFYGLPANEIEIRFAEQRMGFITKTATFSGVVRRFALAMKNRMAGAPDRFPGYAGMARPRAGFKTFYGAIQKILEDRGAQFRFGVQPQAIRRNGASFVVSTDAGDLEAERVISTMPVNETLKLIGEAPEPKLSSSDLLTLYVSFEGERGFEPPILYNFDGPGRWKRLTMHSDAYGRAEGREFFNVEIPTRDADIKDLQSLYDNFRSHTAAANLFRGDMRLEGGEMTKAAYPAYVLGSGEALSRALGKIEAFGLEAMGRQGRYDYLPTAGHVMEQVEREMAASQQRAAANMSGK